jgi:hypothetical protein
MLRDVVDGIHSEIECTRMRAWAEETLPQIHLKLVNSLRKFNLEERPFVTEDSLPNNKVIETLTARFLASLSMCSVWTAGQAEKAAGSATALPH